MPQESGDLPADRPKPCSLLTWTSAGQILTIPIFFEKNTKLDRLIHRIFYGFSAQLANRIWQPNAIPRRLESAAGPVVAWPKNKCAARVSGAFVEGLVAGAGFEPATFGL
jgi:hypothetical protein